MLFFQLRRKVKQIAIPTIKHSLFTSSSNKINTSNSTPINNYPIVFDKLSSTTINNYPLVLSSTLPRITDLMKEIIAIQALNPKLILLIQVGHFYEIYDHDLYLSHIA